MASVQPSAGVVTMYSESEVLGFLDGLKSLGLMPAHIEFSNTRSTHIVNVYDTIESNIISQSVNTGISRSRQVALIKALTERVERKALQASGRRWDSDEFSRRSDGMAAYPTIKGRDFARKYSRSAALCEAIERYVWATWWDNEQIFYRVNLVDISDPALRPSMDLMSVISRSTPFRGLWLIEPVVVNSNIRLYILFAELEEMGWISGGAAGPKDQIHTVLFRGISEMLRHSLAYRRARKNKLEPTTFYEKRLMFFASGEGDYRVRKRLKSSGRSPIFLPALKVDQEISGKHDGLSVVHRCLFAGQPYFVGGELDRLCL